MTDEEIVRVLADFVATDKGTGIVFRASFFQRWNPLDSIQDARECMIALPEDKRARFIGFLCAQVMAFLPIPEEIALFALIAATPRQLSTAMALVLKEAK